MPYAVFENAAVGEDMVVSDVDSIVRGISPEYCISGVACLQQLGLSSWPLSWAEKVSRRDLRRAVISCMESTGTDG